VKYQTQSELSFWTFATDPGAKSIHPAEDTLVHKKVAIHFILMNSERTNILRMQTTAFSELQ